jgi:CheY-like chemotaxis protein
MCILVVEDDFLIRMILVEELLDAGYVVKEAETGDQAVALLDGIDPPLTLLVTDIHMPGRRSGVDLAAHVRDRMPSVPIIYTTGRPDALSVAGHLDRRQSLVRKPYVPSEIITRIQNLLAA